MSAVNLSEVVAKLHEGGVPDESQAVRAGLLRTATRSIGMSQGDRACLSAAASCDALAVTTDRAWRKLKVEIAVEVLR